jgi:hypothetical protein
MRMHTNKRITFFLYLNLMLLPMGTRVYPCTIFYLANDSVVLAGNNEDWEDPLPIMWFYPSSGSKNGWIKFGWGSGFPQGGMNEHGLFWDATSGPRLEMPDSESTKEKYSGPLMQKIIEECATVEEAIDVFSRYYCEDQYKAQYLVGDSRQQAIIDEGDSIIHMDKGSLILTNFYHSHPELGGYPCWRYDIASEMIANSSAYTTFLVGSILSATHQEGKYPTQYSQIYDPQNCTIYLFYYHNYKEYIFLDLKEELGKGYRSYEIPALFSRVRLLYPDAGEKVGSTTVNFSWEGKADSQYELLYSTDADFEEHVSEVTVPGCESPEGKPGRILLLAGLVILVPVLRRNRLVPGSMLILLMLLLHVRCEKEEPSPADEVTTLYETVEGLLPDTTYYWKIRATAPDQDAFQSLTLARPFTSGS